MLDPLIDLLPSQTNQISMSAMLNENVSIPQPRPVIGPLGQDQRLNPDNLTAC